MLIGVFDSGIGGLTVLDAIRAKWPSHSTLYLGDTARVPYGSKSGETVQRYARQNARFLLDQGIDLLVIACNTASAFGVEPLKAELPIPVIGVIEPGASAAVAAVARHDHESSALPPLVGVIGTGATIASGAYEHALRALRADLRIVKRACPLFVPLVEEGWEATTVARDVAKKYLGDWLAADNSPGLAVSQTPEQNASDAHVLSAAKTHEQPAAVVLGCTHYPVLKPMLAELFGPRVALIDSAEATAAALTPYLADAPPEPRPTHRLCVTDGAPGFATIAERILHHPPPPLELVDIAPVHHTL